MEKILYIEDHKDTAETVKMILSKAGFKVDISLSGKDGIKQAKKNYDLILLDIMMPDMSGWDVFKTLKKTIKAKFVFLSVLPVSAERIEEFRKSGISDYITKPFKTDNLIARLKKALK